MKEIRMVDLKGQYEKIQEEIDNAVLDVIRSTAYINGPEVQKFKEELGNYLGVKHVIPCANGTDALQVSMMALDLKPGDEVITSAFTFIATAEVIELLKLKPVFVDVDPETFNIIPGEIEKAITPKTKAIVPVHLFGQSVNMQKIMDISRKHNLFVIEDACQSIGASYNFPNGEKKKTGAIGHTGCTSFFPSKNLGCYGDGGAIFTNDDEIADKLSVVVNHGMKKRYYHDLVGVNSRLDSIQAAILRIKLKYLDQYAHARRKAADLYDKGLANNPNIKTPVRSQFSDHVFHQYTLITDGIDRDKLQEYLKEKNIPNAVYYPVPLHLQKAFQQSGFKQGDLPVTEDLSHKVLSLPMHTELDEEQVNYITSTINEFCK